MVAEETFNSGALLSSVGASGCPNCGGGSGGTIYIKSRNILGIANVTVNGGNGGSANTGTGGGGGGVAIIETFDTVFEPQGYVHVELSPGQRGVCTAQSSSNCKASAATMGFYYFPSCTQGYGNNFDPTSSDEAEGWFQICEECGKGWTKQSIGRYITDNLPSLLWCVMSDFVVFFVMYVVCLCMGSVLR